VEAYCRDLDPHRGLVGRGLCLHRPVEAPVDQALRTAEEAKQMAAEAKATADSAAAAVAQAQADASAAKQMAGQAQRDAAAAKSAAAAANEKADRMFNKAVSK